MNTKDQLQNTHERSGAQVRVRRALGAAAAVLTLGVAVHQPIEQAASAVVHAVQPHETDVNRLKQVQLQVMPGETADDLLHEAGDTDLSGGERQQLEAYVNAQGTAHDQYGGHELAAGQQVSVPVEPAHR